jgi:hypothetical protein
MELRTEKGMVGFFDVLGYQSIIDNNKISDAASILSKSFTRIPEKVKKRLAESLVDGKEIYKTLQGRMRIIIISDSIVMAIPFLPSDGKKPEEEKKVNFANRYQLFYFLLSASFLLRMAFDAGFPLRGAIDYGEFYIEDHTFAGRPFINAFRIANQLEMSGCIATKEAETEFRRHLEEDPINDIFFSYLVPLKNNENKRWLTLKWLCPFPEWGESPKDIRQYIVDKFHAHNKDVPRDVFPKIDNTEMILRYSEYK